MTSYLSAHSPEEATEAPNSPGLAQEGTVSGWGHGSKGECICFACQRLGSVPSVTGSLEHLGESSIQALPDMVQKLRVQETVQRG